MAPGVSAAALVFAAAVPGNAAISVVQERAKNADAPYIIGPTQKLNAGIDSLNFGAHMLRGEWIDFWGNNDFLIREKCCEMAVAHKIRPYKTWGDISDEDKDWWKAHHCTSIVGATSINTQSTLPACHKERRIAQFTRKRTREDLLALHRMDNEHDANGNAQEPMCTQEDRESIDAQYVIDKPFKKVHADCRPQGPWGNPEGKLERGCFGAYFDIPDECSGCFADFYLQFVYDTERMERTEASTVETMTCWSECYFLRGCVSPEECPESLKYCEDCVGQRISKFHYCLGGPIKKELTVLNFLTNMIGVSWYDH